MGSIPHPDPGDTSGPEILLALAPDSRSPLRSQLREALREAVHSGRLAPGQRLPASRVLAADLGLTRRLVAEVYEQLTAEGYLTARRGSGTWVAGPNGAPGPRPAGPRSPEPRPPRWDLRPGLPSLAHFPRREWRRALQAAVTTASNTDLGYPDPAGHPRLREVVAAYLTRVRGADATPRTTLICAGFTQGLDLLCRTLHLAGARTVALEDPGLPHRAGIVRHCGMTPLPIPVDADGLIVEALPARGVDAVLTTPTHQFPTGVTLAPHRRAQLLTWAVRAGAVVVEDDYDGEFRLDRRPTAALQGSAPDRVVYIGSTSKALAPALRLGWLISPPELLGRLIETKFLTDHGSGVIDQIALAEMITKGDYDRHIRLSRTRYRARREALETAIDAHRVPVRLAGIPAGAQTLATLPTGLDPDDLVERAATAGIVLDSVTRYQHTTHAPGRSLVLGYGNITPRRIDGAMFVLGHLISTV